MKKPAVRILLGGVSSLGPGKVALLEEIDRQGSISAAARTLGMSYRRAWLLVESMNNRFTQVLVSTATGGKRGGGAALTAFGREVLQRYRAMERKAYRAIEDDVTQFAELMRG